MVANENQIHWAQIELLDFSQKRIAEIAKTRITWQNKAQKICEDWAQLIFRGVSVFFCSKKLGLPKFVFFKLSQTRKQSISFVQF